MRRWFLVLAACFACLGGCGQREDGQAPEGPGVTGAAGAADHAYRVVCTVGMITDVVRQVAGQRAEVVGMLGPGVDPHIYRPTRDDSALLASADIVFYNGYMLEGRMTHILERIGENKPVIALAQRLDKNLLLDSDEEDEPYDPHVWMDVSLWAKVVADVAAALGEHDPDHAQQYHANAQTLMDRMMQLHEYGKQVIASIPEANRLLITSHDAFSYMGRAYGIEVMGVQGISTDSEAGLADINRLVSLIVERRVPAVFVESSVSPRYVQALIDGARSRGHNVAIGGELYSDAMGPRNTYEGTYIGMLDHNLSTIARALGGDVPDNGFRDFERQQTAAQ